LFPCLKADTISGCFLPW